MMDRRTFLSRAAVAPLLAPILMPLREVAGQTIYLTTTNVRDSVTPRGFVKR